MRLLKVTPEGCSDETQASSMCLVTRKHHTSPKEVTLGNWAVIVRIVQGSLRSVPD